MPLALWALTLSAFAIGTTEFVIVGLVPKGSPKIIIKFQSHHSHPYFSNRVALPPVRNRLALPSNLAAAA